MSYRLIDANAIAESYSEVNDMPCIYADLPCGLDGGHYDMRGTSELQAENAKLREQMERLVTLLRADCDIEASWDGLRRFWSIGLTEDGCLMRDRACKAEAENAKLRELVEDMLDCIDIQIAFERVPARWMQDEFAGRARELGIEVTS